MRQTAGTAAEYSPKHLPGLDDDLGLAQGLEDFTFKQPVARAGLNRIPIRSLSRR
jgi:hypothetical protein